MADDDREVANNATPLAQRKVATKTPGSNRSKSSRRSSARKKKKGGAVQQLPNVPAPPDLTGFIVAPFAVSSGHQNWTNCFYRWQLELQGRLEESPIDPVLQGKYERWKDTQVRRANNMIHRSGGPDLSINRFAKLMEIGVISQEEAHTLRFDVQQDLEEVMDEEEDLTEEQLGMGLRKIGQRTFRAVPPTKSAADLPPKRVLTAIVQASAVGRAMKEGQKKNSVKNLETNVEEKHIVTGRRKFGATVSTIPAKTDMEPILGDSVLITEVDTCNTETHSLNGIPVEVSRTVSRKEKEETGHSPSTTEEEAPRAAVVARRETAIVAATSEAPATEDNRISLLERPGRLTEREQEHHPGVSHGSGNHELKEDMEQETNEETEAKQVATITRAEKIPVPREDTEQKAKEGTEGKQVATNTGAVECPVPGGTPMCLAKTAEKPVVEGDGRGRIGQKLCLDESLQRPGKRKCEDAEQVAEDENERQQVTSAPTGNRKRRMCSSMEMDDVGARAHVAKRARLDQGPTPRTWFQYGIDIFKHALTF